MRIRPLLYQTPSFWIATVGRNYKKYNPWIGPQLLGIRDQFLLFHPLVLLWDLKRIQQFLQKIQGYNKYSFVIVESRPHIRQAIELYLRTKGIPKNVCHLLNFEFPGTLTNQYYLNTQSPTSDILVSKQIFVFFDYFLNKQFYLESLIVPSVRFSLYSLHNLPINLQYGLPARSGILLAIKLLLKLLLRPLIDLPPLEIKSGRRVHIIPFAFTLPWDRKTKQSTINPMVFTSSKFNQKNRVMHLLKWTKSFPLLRLRKRLFIYKQKHTRIRKSYMAKLVDIGKRLQKKKFKKNRNSGGALLNFLNKKPIITFLFNAAAFRAPFIKQIKKKLLLQYKTNKLETSRKTKLILYHNFQPHYWKYTQVGSTFTQNLLWNNYRATALIKKKKIKLLDKFTRTCNIKTQKEWQQVITKQKLKNEKIKQQQRARNRTAHSKQSKHLHVKNPFYLKPPRSSYNKRAKHSRQHMDQFIVKQSRRYFSTKTRKSLKNKKYRFRTMQKRYRAFFKSGRLFRGKYSLRRFRPSVRFAQHWKRLSLIFSNINKNRMSGHSVKLLNHSHVSNPHKPSTTYGKWSFSSYSPYWFSNHLQSLHLKEKTKYRLRRVKRIKKLFKRIAKKPDRRWYQRKKKKIMIRLLNHSFQRIYMKKNIIQGNFYWRRLRKTRLKRHHNEKKWRHRYFRYFIWKKNIRSILRKKKRTTFVWRPVISSKVCLQNKSTSFTPKLLLTPIKFFKHPSIWQKQVKKTKIWPKRQRLKKKSFVGRKKLKQHFRLTLLRFLQTRMRFEIKRHRVLLISKYLKMENHAMAHVHPEPKIKIKRQIQIKIRKKSALRVKKIKKYYKLKLLRRTAKKQLRVTLSWNKQKWRETLNKIKKGLRRVPASLIFTQGTCVPLALNGHQKNRTTAHWFRLYRNSKLLQTNPLKTLSKSFRETLERKRHFIKKYKLPGHYGTTLKLRKLVCIKKHTFWNWRQFKIRVRTREELQRYIQNFQHTPIKLHKHKNLCLILSKQLRQQRVNQFFHKYKHSTWYLNTPQAIKRFQMKPVKISKFAFFDFNGRVYKNRTILIGLKKTKNSKAQNFFQCYTKRRFWANDFYGPSQLSFWISRKARRLKTPKQQHFSPAQFNYRLNISLPNFSCLASISTISNKVNPSLTENSVHPVSPFTSTELFYELHRQTMLKQTFKFFISNSSRNTEKKIRWFWYYIKNKHKVLAGHWQECLTSPKKLDAYLRKRKSKKVLVFYRKVPRVVKNKIKYILRCDRRRRRRLRQRTFKGPFRFRRKYRIYYQFTSLVKLNSHRNKYGKPNLDNHINQYFLRKNILRRFLRIIYGPKLTNHYFKHFSKLLFIKKFKFWTLYTFFYLRLDFISIFLKFALNLKASRYFITSGLILVNNRIEKPSRSIFIGDVIHCKLVPTDKFKLRHEVWSLSRIDSAYAPRIAKDHRYQVSLRIPPFFEYNARIRSGIMFRLPWYYEVRSKLINKENFLLVARGAHSI